MSSRRFHRCAATRRGLWTVLMIGLTSLGHDGAIARGDLPAARGREHRSVQFRGSLPSNPAIVALVAAVSADSLRADVETLVAFGTRHANSDTVSSTAGIGAARRWTAARFASIAGGALATEYVSFDTTACGIPGTHRNVVARLAGSGSVERALLLSAHLDSRTLPSCDALAPAPGADDDASGVALTLEVARLLAPLPVESDVLFVAMAAEEMGLLGSRWLAGQLALAGARLDAVVTCDIVGNVTGCADPACPVGEPVIVDSTSVRHFSRGPETSPQRQLTRALALVAMRYVPELSVTLVPAEDRPGRSGDHVPFAELGYAAARFTEANENGDGTGLNGHQHNGEDLVEHMSFSYLARVTALNAAGFASIAMAPESPQMPLVTPVGADSIEVSWPSVTTAADVAGYRVALRRAFVDTLFYGRIDDVGEEVGVQQTRVLADVDGTAGWYVSVSAYDVDGNESIFSPEYQLAPVVSVTGTDDPSAGASLRVRSAPGAGLLRVAVHTPHTARVVLDLLDVSGRLVTRLYDRVRAAGEHLVVGRPQAASGAPLVGTFFLHLTLDGRSRAAQKVVLVE